MLCGVALACAAGRAEAADARHRFAIPARPYADALIELGIQANVTVLGSSSCGPGGRAELSGRYSVREALARLLAGAPCRYRIVDARTVLVTPAPREPTAPARDPDVRAAPPALLAEVVVTATKRPAAVARLPGGVSAISRDQIELTGSADVGRTVGQVAGVISTNLGPGRDKLLIRGVSDGAFTGRTRSTVATYLDDAPINYNAPDPDLRLVDVDRIEVIRGPQGALYGSGAMSGIYRIVTRKPDLREAAAGVAGALAWTHDGEMSHEIEGYLSLPIIEDRAAVRLVAYEDRQGGYLDNVALRIADVDRTRRDGGRAALRLQLSDGWRLDALAATQHLRSDDTQYVTAGPGGGQRRGSVRETHNNDFSYAGVALQGDLGWASLSSTVAYVHHVFSSQYQAEGDDLASLGLAPPDVAVFSESARVDMGVVDVVLRSAGGGRLDWLAGAYASQTDEETPSALSILSPARPRRTVYTEARKDRVQELALYGEASYAFAPGWTATLGGRVFRNRVRTTADIVVATPGAPRAFRDLGDFDGFTPKISVQREFEGGDLVYALVSEGYRPGGFNSAGILPIRANRAAFRPDRLRNFEVGAKLRRLDGRLTARTAAYYDDWVNIQSDQYRPSGFAFTGNVGDARIIGLEAELSYEWAFGLSLQLHGLVSDSKVRNANRGFADAVAGDLPGVPNLSGGLLAVYTRPLGGDLALRLVGEASYVGGSDLSFDAMPTPARRRQSDYLRARLSAEVAADRWRLQAFVANPLNDTGDTFGYGNPFTFGDVRQTTPQRPRTVGLRLAAGF